MTNQPDPRPDTCPSWCELTHAVLRGEDDAVHIGGLQCVKNTLMRLCATVDPETGRQEGPYVLVGTQEFTLDEADVLAAALRLLTSQGRRPARRSPAIPSPREAT